MPLKHEKDNILTVIDTSDEIENCSNNSIEVIRKYSQQDKINTSWEATCYVSFKESNDEKDYNQTPPFESILNTNKMSPANVNSIDSSTQTDIFVTLPVDCSIVDMSLSFNKDFNTNESTPNDNSEQSFRIKRHRPDTNESDDTVIRPLKKTKSSGSCIFNSPDLIEPKAALDTSVSSCQLSSSSEVSFKSIKSNSSFRIRNRHPRSESSLFKNALQRSRKMISMSHHNYPENITLGNMFRLFYSYRLKFCMIL